MKKVPRLKGIYCGELSTNLSDSLSEQLHNNLYVIEPIDAIFNGISLLSAVEN